MGECVTLYYLFSLHTNYLRCKVGFQIFSAKFLECPHSSISGRLVWPTPLPSENENLARLRDFGFELVWSTLLPKDFCGRWCVETNRCIPQVYGLVQLFIPFVGWYGTVGHCCGYARLHITGSTQISGWRWLLWTRVWLVVCRGLPLWNVGRWVF